MRMGNYRWLLAFLTAFTTSSFAADYYWASPGNSAAPGQYSSPGEACEAARAYWASVRTSGPATIDSLTNSSTSSTTRYSCRIRYHSSQSNTATSTLTITRYGDSCPQGATYNTTTGACDSPKEPGGETCGTETLAGAPIPKITDQNGNCVSYLDADLPSQCAHLSKSTRAKNIFVSFDGQGKPLPPPPVEEQGCVANVIDYTHCTAPAPKASGGVSLGPAPARCLVGLDFTGEVGQGDAPAYAAPPLDPGALCAPGLECLPEVPPQVTETEPCTYVSDGEGRQVCSSSKYVGEPGKDISCGTFQGEFRCEGKKPTSNGIKIDTTVETKQNADGTSTTTKTDTHTKVICSGPGACTTQVTNNKTTTTKDSGGKTVSESSNCTGANCASGGKGGPNDGDGDGVDDCASKSCEEEPTEVGGQNWHESGDDTIASVMGDFTDRLSSSPVVSAADDFFTLSVGGNCPIWTASTWVFDIRIDQHCTTEIPWALIRAIILSCAAFVAFRWAIL